MMTIDIPDDVEAALGDNNPNLDGDTVQHDDGTTSPSELA